MAVSVLRTARCICDGCGVVQDVPIWADTSVLESLPPGWVRLRMHMDKRTDTGTHNWPEDTWHVCSGPCAAALLKKVLVRRA